MDMDIITIMITERGLERGRGERGVRMRMRKCVSLKVRVLRIRDRVGE
jgi:hypothetical protein